MKAKLFFFLFLLSCTVISPPGPDPTKTRVTVEAVDPTHLRLRVEIEGSLGTASAENLDNYQIHNFLVEPPASLAVLDAEADGNEVLLTTAQQEAATYTIAINGLLDSNGTLIADGITANVQGLGDILRSNMTFVVDGRLHVPLEEPSLFLTVDPVSGLFSEQLRSVPLLDEDGDGIFAATVAVAVDPRRTIDPLDDSLGADRRAYAALVRDETLPASDLTFFEVLLAEERSVDIALTTPLLQGPETEDCSNGVDDDSDTVVDCADPDCSQNAACEVIDETPLVDPPTDPTPNDGFTLVRIACDDRAARVLKEPKVKVSLNAQGFFDAATSRILTLSDPDGDRIFTVDVAVKVDPARVLNGNTPATFPFVTFLREGSEDFEGISNVFVVPDETPRVVNLHVGNPNLVPVTFRVDASQAFLNASGTERGVRTGEAVFLTGEFSLAEDAFGRNAADAFTGGENPVLEMTERADAPGVWEKTIFLPGNRPFGWKVVRCPTVVGCSQLNQFVTSSGRAFPTVMKNLVTENTDASSPASTAVIINPKALSQVTYEDGTVHNYQNALVHTGLRGQPTPPAPSETIMFKQEVPDLVAIVGTTPLKTPIFVVGTWRDINLPLTIQQIIQQAQTLNLTDFDYDDGLVGFFPPVRPDDFSNNTPESCNNGSDDDGDGATDCTDSDCANAANCQQPGVESCSNTTDDDGDGAIDCADSDCSANVVCQAPAKCPANPPTAPTVSFVMDGVLDADVPQISGGQGNMRLFARVSGDGVLYVATDDAGEGSDHFLFVSATEPTGANLPAPFGKAGLVQSGSGPLFFLADENDNDFEGWFRSNAVGGDTLLGGASFQAATQVANGGILEGVIDLNAAFGSIPATVFLAAAPYFSNDGAPLVSVAQVPSGNGDGNISGAEFLTVCLPGLEILP